MRYVADPEGVNKLKQTDRFSPLEWVGVFLHKDNKIEGLGAAGVEGAEEADCSGGLLSKVWLN